MQIPVLLGKLAVPFLNSRRILEKGTFFIGVFRKLSILFCIKPEYPGAQKLSDAPAFFIFRKFLFFGTIGVRKSCGASKKGTG